jgi:hypothetical protein
MKNTLYRISMSTVVLALAPVLSLADGNLDKDIKAAAKKLANGRLPSFIQVNYNQSDGEEKDSWSLDYDFKKKSDFSINYDPGTASSIASFDGLGWSVFAKGAYDFSDSPNTKELSEVGVEGYYRLHHVHYTKFAKGKNPHDTDANRKLMGDCMLEAGTYGADTSKCSQKYDLPEYDHWQYYLDTSIHAKMEGDQKFDERSYVAGFSLSTSAQLNHASPLHWINIFDYPAKLFGGNQSPYSFLPILMLGIDHVEPEDDSAREALDQMDSYARARVELHHSSPLGFHKGQPIKLNFSYRFFQEIDPEDEIDDAKLDQFKYYSVALQMPASLVSSIFDGAKIEESSIILSYTAGELPFNLQDQEVFEIGFRSNVDFANLF